MTVEEVIKTHNEHPGFKTILEISCKGYLVIEPNDIKNYFTLKQTEELIFQFGKKEVKELSFQFDKDYQYYVIELEE